MSIYDNINSGKYMPHGDCPQCPPTPAILRKSVESLTDDELAAIPGVRASHEKQKFAYRENMRLRQEEQNRLERLFYRDICADNEMNPDHPFSEAAYAIAWENGHSAGFSEVANCFDDAVRLWKVAVEHGMRTA